MKIIYLYIGLELNHEDFIFINQIEFGGGVRMIEKVNYQTINQFVKYGLEYGKDELEMAIFLNMNQELVVVDDVYFYSGTMDIM